MYPFAPYSSLAWFVAAAAPSIPQPTTASFAALGPYANLPALSTEFAGAAGAALLPAAGPRLSASVGATPDTSEAPSIPSHPALFDRFFIGMGTGFMNSTTEARLDSSVGIGTTVDFEDVLGLDETSWVPQGLARWRFSERWRLELEFFQLNRSNTKVTATDIDWGDQTFPAGSTVEAKFDVSVTRLSCGYSFFKTQDKEVGVAFGFHLTDFDAGLHTSGGTEEGGAILAPLPVISMYGQVALTDTWALASRADIFKLEYDPYRGHVFALGLDALCQPWRHLGFGIGYRNLQIEAGAEGSDWEGELSTNYSGPMFFIFTSF